MVSALRAGTTLTVEAAANDSGQRLSIAVSLDGFSAALARLMELSR
jgi:invasion protein IalB